MPMIYLDDATAGNDYTYIKSIWIFRNGVELGSGVLVCNFLGNFLGITSSTQKIQNIISYRKTSLTVKYFYKDKQSKNLRTHIWH